MWIIEILGVHPDRFEPHLFSRFYIIDRMIADMYGFSRSYTRMLECLLKHQWVGFSGANIISVVLKIEPLCQRRTSDLRVAITQGPNHVARIFKGRQHISNRFIRLNIVAVLMEKFECPIRPVLRLLN